MTQLDPIVNQPSLYINGGVVSNDATTPNTVLDVAAGQFRDSNNAIDMVLGDFLNEGTGSANSVTLLNAAVNGINGLDTGSLGASKMYAIYVIGDSSNKNPTGVILSLASNSVPLLPFGYDSYRKIAYWATDSSSHFLLGYYTTSSVGVRTFYYDALQATAVTAGGSTSYANVNLIAFVPNVNNLKTYIYSAYSPNAAGHTLSLQAGNATGAQVIISGQVASTVLSTISAVLAQPVSLTGVSSPVINYKVSNGSDTVAIDVAGFEIAL